MITGVAPIRRPRVRVQRPGATEGHQREVAWVEATLHRHESQRAEHVLIRDVHDARRRLHEIQIQGIRDVLYSPLRRFDVQDHVAA
jgi:hypothetical protein